MKKQKTYFIPCLTMLLSASITSLSMAAGQVVTVDNHRPDEHFHQLPKIQPHVNLLTKSKGKEPSQTQSLSLTAEQLLQRPDLLIRALIPVLRNNDMQGVALLLPIYEKLPHHDPLLLKWAHAIVAKKRGELTKSIRLYRELIAEQPQLQIAFI